MHFCQMWRVAPGDAKSLQRNRARQVQVELVAGLWGPWSHHQFQGCGAAMMVTVEETVTVEDGEMGFPDPVALASFFGLFQ